MDNVSKIAELQEKVQAEIKKQAEYLIQVESAIKRLRKDKKITQANIFRLEGAAQGYSDSVLLMRDMVKESVGQEPMETVATA
jgi:hypothetical protein